MSAMLPNGSAVSRRDGALKPRSCLLLLAMLPFGFFWPVTLGRKVFADGDLFFYNYPLLHTTAAQWRAGHVPLWNDYLFGGTPLLASMQAGVFYLPNALFLVLPAWLAYGQSILLHYSLIGVFTFLYLRALRLRPEAGLVGGLTFMLGGFTLANLGHVSTLRTLPWLPLMLYAFERWRQQGDRLAVALGGIAAGLMVLAGHPQIPLYAFALLTTYALWFAAAASGTARWRLCAGLLAILGVGAGLSAVQTLTTLQALPEYLRPGEGGYEYFSKHSLHPLMLANLVLPQLIPSNMAEQAVYLGIAPLLLVLVSARAPHAWGRHRAYFAVIAGGGLALAMGEHAPLHPWMHRVPLYRAFSAPARNWFEVSFALAALSALGTQALLAEETAARARRLCMRVVAGFALLLLAGTLAVAGVQRYQLGLPDAGLALADVRLSDVALLARVPYLVVSLVLLAVIAGMRARLGLRIAWLLLPPWIATDLLSFGGSLYALHEPAVFTEPPASLRALPRDAAPFRIVTLEMGEGIPESKELLARNYNAVAGVQSVNGFDSLMLRQLAEASGGILPTYGVVAGKPAWGQPRFQRLLDLLNTRFVLVPARSRLMLDPERFRPVFRSSSVVIYENRGALPRFLFLFEAWRVTHEQAIAALATGRIGRQEFLPHMALVETPTGGIGPPGFGRGPRPPAGVLAGTRIEPLSLAPSDVRLRAQSPADAVLVHATNYAPGWRAYVDGAPAPLYRVDGLLQGVALPAGRHEVRFVYRPGGFVAGAAISAMTLLLVGAGAWRQALRNAKEAP